MVTLSVVLTRDACFWLLFRCSETETERAKREEIEEEQEILKTKVMKTALMAASEIAHVRGEQGSACMRLLRPHTRRFCLDRSE
jgi:hypothetical protein